MANIEVSLRNGCAIVILNRPEIRNAFDDSLIANLAKTLKKLDADDSVRAVVLMGAGSAFCAGADLNWMKRMANYTLEQNLKDTRALAAMLKTLDRMSKPTIARVHGPAFAGGVGLVAACDIAVGTMDAEFALTESKLGLSPATISPYVVRAMGASAARRYFVTAERFTASQAQAMGLVHEVCAPDALDASVEAMLETVVQNGPAAVRLCKQLVRDVEARPIDADLRAETARRIADIRASAEGKEGLQSFLNKRPPNWLIPRA